MTCQHIHRVMPFNKASELGNNKKQNLSVAADKKQYSSADGFAYSARIQCLIYNKQLNGQNSSHQMQNNAGVILRQLKHFPCA